MYLKYFTIFSLALLMRFASVNAQNILINEFMASNTAVLADDAGDFDDWVELYNPTNAPINIGGWYVSDAASSLTLWKIPDTDPALTTIAAGGYLLLWFDNEPLEGILHCKPKLSADGESIYLTAPDGITVMDSRDFNVQIPNISEGRTPNGGAGWGFYVQPTPSAANTTTVGAPKVAPVIPSAVGGKYTDSQSIALTCATIGAKIYYTTDGTEPTQSSSLYVSQLEITATTPLRARAFYSPMLPSDLMTHTYFIGINHSFPIVSLVFQDADFFAPNTGIYSTPLEDLTTRTNIEFFENGSSAAAFNQYVETEIQGTASAVLPQKSLDIKPKAALGSPTINYKIFPDLPYEQYKRVVLRNGGQDWNIMMFRDEFVTSSVSDLTDLGGILSKPELLTQAWRPSVVYFNGQYWGIHNIRERMNRFYVEQRYGYSSGTFDMVENFNEVLSGDTIEWFKFNDFLYNGSFESDVEFEKLKQRIDYQNYLDYCALYVYIDNYDWPGNNVRRFRERKPDGKWRWICYDFDYSLGVYQQNAWNTGDATPNSLQRLLVPNGYLWPNPEWATLMFQKCWQNAGFRRDFANRMADFMNTIFAPERFSNRLDSFTNLYQPEIKQHFERWTNGYYEPYWLENIQKTHNFGINRPANMREHMVGALPEATGTAELTINALPANGGVVKISTITLSEPNFPWKGNYFTGVKLPLKAVPNPGFVFVNWSDPALGSSDSVWVTLAQAQNITANFMPELVLQDTVYCTPGSFSPWLEYIKNVKIGSYVRESSKEAYVLVPNVAFSLELDKSYPISLTTGYSWETFDEYWRIWIDYDGNEQFSDNEIAFEGKLNRPPNGAYATGVLDGQIKMPGNAPLGQTRMRIGMKRGSNAQPCEMLEFGEFEDYTIEIKAAVVQPPLYCVSHSDEATKEWISGVYIGPFVNQSGAKTYSDFTGLSTNLIKGTQVLVNVRTSFGNATHDEYYKIWVDWNQNNVFEEATETAFSGKINKPSSGTTAITLSGAISVPSTAKVGTTRMRVSMKRGGFATPCEIFNFGEVEDYTLQIGAMLISPPIVIDSTSLQKITLYPNPAEEEVHIQLPDYEDKTVEVTLFSPLGIVAKTWTFPSLSIPKVSLGVEDLSNGHYYMWVTATGKKPFVRLLTISRLY